MNIPEQIRFLLWGQDKSQTWLAQEAGLSITTVNTCISGKHDPRCETAEMMLRPLGYELCIRELKNEDGNNI